MNNRLHLRVLSAGVRLLEYLRAGFLLHADNAAAAAAAAAVGATITRAVNAVSDFIRCVHT